MLPKITLALAAALCSTTLAVGQSKVSGTSHCGKPDPQYTIEVGDRPNHAFRMAKSTCTWTKPPELAGVQDKEYVATVFNEMRANRSRDHGYVVHTMANGDNAYSRFLGTSTLKDGVPQHSEGKWSYIGGTGKLKGLSGSGTYKCESSADGRTCEVEGEYSLPK